MKHVFKLSMYLYLLFWATFSWGQARSFKPIAGGKAPEGTERRLALVVGNRDNARPDARLLNPLNDATDMTKALNGLGFDVITANNLNLTSFKKAVDDFGSRLADYDVALFYYSGHALQFNGENYLVPIDATLQTLSDTEDDCLRLGRIMGKMKAANIKNNLVFLDACRSNPFPKNAGDRAAPQQGLLIPNNPAGSLVVFATEEGNTADDNASARNGLFTSELLRYLTMPNMSLSDIVLNTRQGVYKRSGQRQLPSDYNKMLGAFYFVKTAGAAPAPAPAVVAKVELPVRPKPVDSEPTPAVAKPAKPNADLDPIPMVFVEGGTFQMGSDAGEANQKPVHSVTVNNSRMATTETTVAQYRRYCDETKTKMPDPKETFHYGFQRKYLKEWENYFDNDNHPITGVNWEDAVGYCEWLSRKTGLIFRLPTEEEWEYAARGGNKSHDYIYAGSNSATTVAWTEGGKPHPVGGKLPNELGLYDMSGNVNE